MPSPTKTLTLTVRIAPAHLAILARWLSTKGHTIPSKGTLVRSALEALSSMIRKEDNLPFPTYAEAIRTLDELGLDFVQSGKNRQELFSTLTTELDSVGAPLTDEDFDEVFEEAIRLKDKPRNET